MKRILALTAVLVLAAGSAWAVAPDRIGRLDWNIYGAGAFNEEGAEDAGYINTGLSYGINEWLALGVSAGYQETDAADDETLGSADIMADIILRCPQWKENNLIPYLKVGLGVVGQYIEDDNGGAPTNNGDDVDDTSFGAKIGLGVDYFFQGNWALNGEIAWLTQDNDLSPSSIGSDGVDSFFVGGGLKYAF